MVDSVLTPGPDVTSGSAATVGSHAAVPPLPSLGEATRVWLKIGCLSFGGPAGQIGLPVQRVSKVTLRKVFVVNGLGWPICKRGRFPGIQAGRMAATSWLSGGMGWPVAGMPRRSPR